LYASSGTYTTSTAIHTSQFSSSLRVIIHCATRLAAVSVPSVHGTHAGLCRSTSV
jgi:hypothetical protein